MPLAIPQILMVVIGIGEKFDICGALADRPWFVRLDFGPEAVVVGYVVDFSKNAFLVGVAVAARDMPVAVALLFPEVRPVMTLYLVAEIVRNWFL